MTEADIAGWVFEAADGARWAVQADTKEAALRILTHSAPSDLEIVDERTIPQSQVDEYQLEPGEAVLQTHRGDGRS